MPRTKVAVYFRYSSNKKAQKQNTEARQKAELLEECVRRDWKVVWVDGDKATSGDAKVKPKLEELKQKISTKEIVADALYISSWDRLTRKDSLDYSDDVRWLRNAGMKLAIKDKGSNLIGLDDNQQLFQFQMEVYQANQYLKDLSSKVISGQTQRFKAKKLGFSRTPFGFDKQESDGDLGSTIIPNADISLVPAIYEHALKNNVQSAVEILRDSATYRNRSAEPTAAVVKTILRNPIYIGKRTFGVAGVGKHGTIRDNKTNTTYNKNRLKDAALVVDISEIVTPVIEEEVFFKVQNILDENSTQWKKGKRKNNQKKKYKYAGLLRCSHCGAKFVAEKKSKHVNYVCPQSKSKMLRCSGGRKTVREDEVKQFIDKWVKDTWNETGFHLHNFRSALIHYRRFLRQKDGVHESRTVILEGKEENLKQLMEFALSSSGGINDGLLKKIRSLQDEIDEEKESIERSKTDTVDFDWLQEVLQKKPEEIISEYQYSKDDAKALRLYAALSFSYAAMFETTKTLVEKSTPNVTKKEIDRLFFESFDDFHQLIKKLVKEAPNLSSLAEEVELTFRSDGLRNRCIASSFTVRGILQNIDILISVDTSPNQSRVIMKDLQNG